MGRRHWGRWSASIVGRLAGAAGWAQRTLFRRLFGGLPVEVEDALDRAAAQPDSERMVRMLLSVVRDLTPSERVAWAAAADELPDRTSVSAYWVSLVALMLATAGIVRGSLRTLLLVATACGIFMARHQSRHASRLRVPGNVLRSVVRADGSLRADAFDTGENGRSGLRRRLVKPAAPLPDGLAGASPDPAPTEIADGPDRTAGDEHLT